MSTNSISNYYNSMINNFINKTKDAGATSNQDSKPATDSSVSNSNLTDKLDLSSYLSELTGYSNYTSNGNYSNTSSLADYLNGNSSSDTSNGSSSDLASMLGGDSSDANSSNGFFDSIIKQNDAYTNLLIQQALSRMNTTKNEATSTDAKKDDSSGDSTKQSTTTSKV